MSKPISPLVTVTVFALCGVLWILFTDLLILLLPGRPSPELLHWVQRSRTALFVLFASFLLYWLLRKHLGRLQATEKAYFRLFQENPQPMWVFRQKDFRFLEVNEAAIHLYGYTREEFLEKTILDIRPAEDVPRIQENQQQSGMPGYSHSGIWRHYKKDGSLMYVEIASFATIYNNEAAEVISIFDITEKYLAGEALYKQEQLLNTVINSSQHMIWAVNTQLRFIARNEVFLRRSALLEGMEAPDACWAGYYEKSLQGEKQLIELSTGTAEQEWRYIQVSLDPILHEGSITGVVGMAWDVTDKKQHELALQEALERYDIVTQATNDAIWDFDITTNKVLWNDNALHFFGFSNQQEDVAFWSSRIHPEDQQGIMDSVYNAVQERQNHWQGAYRLQDLRGRYRHVISRGYIVYNEKGEPVRMIGAMQDVEDMIRKNEEIRKLSLVASMTHNSVIITDPQSRIEWVNKSFEDLTGYTLEEVKGLQPSTFLHGEGTDPNTLSEIQEKIAASQACIVEVLNYTRAGEPYWVVMDITPIVNAAGKIERHIIIQTNITERKKFVQQLEEKNRLLMEVAYISSHRLRAPVASMLGILALLDREHPANPDNPLFLGYIEKLVHDMDSLLHEMADKCNEIYKVAEPEK